MRRDTSILRVLFFLVCQVVGHVKTCLIILAGYLYFVDLSSVPQEQIIKNLAGVGVAMLGVFAYTYFKLAK
jgi:hypothetical protein